MTLGGFRGLTLTRTGGGVETLQQALDTRRKGVILGPILRVDLHMVLIHHFFDYGWYDLECVGHEIEILACLCDLAHCSYAMRPVDNVSALRFTHRNRLTLR
jgi:hypothetical protein